MNDAAFKPCTVLEMVMQWLVPAAHEKGYGATIHNQVQLGTTVPRYFTFLHVESGRTYAFDVTHNRDQRLASEKDCLALVAKNLVRIDPP